MHAVYRYVEIYINDGGEDDRLIVVIMTVKLLSDRDLETMNTDKHIMKMMIIILVILLFFYEYYYHCYFSMFIIVVIAFAEVKMIITMMMIIMVTIL